MTPGQEANDNNLGMFFDLFDNNGVLGEFVRIASMRRF